MNLYLLVEGRRTEARVYPAWLSHLLPKHTRVIDPQEAAGAHYFLTSGQGYPRILDEGIPAAIEDISIHGGYDYFVVSVDADEDDPEQKREEVVQFVRECTPSLPGQTVLQVIVQTKSIESWFLGNRRVVSANPGCPVLRGYMGEYDIRELCPECMGGHAEFPTVQAFHLDYLERVLRERHLRYSKLYPGQVQERHYLEQLIERSGDSRHLRSFKTLIDLCENVRRHTRAYQTSG